MNDIFPITRVNSYNVDNGNTQCTLTISNRIVYVFIGFGTTTLADVI